MVDNIQRNTVFLENLFKARYFSMLQYSISFLGQRELAEEAVQETFRVAWAKIDNLMASQNPNGWLHLTLKNVLRNMRKKQNYELRLTNEYITHIGRIKPLVESNDIELEVEYGEILSTESWEMLKLSINGYTCNDIAEMYGKTPAACKKQIQRSKEKLKHFLEK